MSIRSLKNNEFKDRESLQSSIALEAVNPILVQPTGSYTPKGTLWKTITASGSHSLPTDVATVTLVIVGGGGRGAANRNNENSTLYGGGSGGGGGGGQVLVVENFPTFPNTLSVTIGGSKTNSSAGGYTALRGPSATYNIGGVRLENFPGRGGNGQLAHTVSLGYAKYPAQPGADGVQVDGTYYGGGGGGGGEGNFGTGGAGGGTPGSGWASSSATTSTAPANTGGGSGGLTRAGTIGLGGSGIVLIYSEGAPA